MVEGVMNGDDIFPFIPTHLLAIAVHPPLKDWIYTWAPRETEILSPEEWFEQGHDIIGSNKISKGLWHATYASGTYIWDLSPIAASAAVE
eukprot:6689078-Ditylum_brightwellii.AAC.1